MAHGSQPRRRLNSGLGSTWLGRAVWTVALRGRSSLVAVLLGVAFLAAFAPSALATGGGQFTVDTPTNVVTIGDEVTLQPVGAGDPVPGDLLELQQSPYPFQGFTAVAQKSAALDPDSGEPPSFTVHPTVTTRYRFAYKRLAQPARLSGEGIVFVYPRATFRWKLKKRTRLLTARERSSFDYAGSKTFLYLAVDKFRRGRRGSIDTKRTVFRIAKRGTAKAQGSGAGYSFRLRISRRAIKRGYSFIACVDLPPQYGTGKPCPRRSFRWDEATTFFPTFGSNF